MEAEDNQQGSEDETPSPENAEQPPTMRLRDLSPEKDPMGAGTPEASEKARD